MTISVTRAIKVCGFIERDGLTDPFFLERGTAVHEECRLIARKDPAAKTSIFFDLVAGYVQSFERWLELEKPEILETEYEVRNEPMGYIGHLDLLCNRRGRLTILDYKCGADEIWHPRQTALYALAFCSMNKDRPTPERAALYLKKDGSLPRLSPHIDRRDFERAKAIITVAHDLIENRKEAHDPDRNVA